MSRFLILLLPLLIVSCQPSSPPEEEAPAAEQIPVLLDTDANNEVDDQHAIAYMLFNDGVFDVVGVTVNRTSNGGDIDAQAAETQRIVDLAGPYGDVPVLKGASGTFAEIQDSVDQPTFDGSEAVDFIIEQVHAHADPELVLIPVGKLTNIALALKKDPSIAEKTVVVWLGSNYPEPGEYNQENDESALAYVLDTNVPFEIAIVRYGEPSGTDAVRVTPAEIQENMAGKGPYVEPPVEGRHGGSFHTFGDYSVNLFEHIELYGDPPSRALFDMAAVAIVKDPSWASAVRIPAPQIVDGAWVERPENPRTIIIWENFDRDAIVGDLFETMERVSGR